MFARFTDIYELVREHREEVDEYDDTWEEPVFVEGILKENQEKIEENDSEEL